MIPHRVFFTYFYMHFLLFIASTWGSNHAGNSFTPMGLYTYIRVIPQGTVDNNLGPDRLAGPKAVDPNYCRQLTLIARPLSGSPNCAW